MVNEYLYPFYLSEMLEKAILDEKTTKQDCAILYVLIKTYSNKAFGYHEVLHLFMRLFNYGRSKAVHRLIFLVDNGYLLRLGIGRLVQYKVNYTLGWTHND